MKPSLGAVSLVVALLSIEGCARHRGIEAAIRVEAASARLAPGGVGAAYLEIINDTEVEDRLTSVDAAGVASTSLHEVVTRGDVARMVARPEGFVIRRGETLALRPGGKHVMLFGVERADERDALPLTLHFEHTGAVHVGARVISAASTE